jgi:hypothetical protein
MMFCCQRGVGKSSMHGKKPVIIIDAQIKLTFEDCWFNSFRDFFEVPILYYEGDIIVNPFGQYFHNTGIHLLET